MAREAEFAGKYLYWMEDEDFHEARELLTREGYSLSPAILTPCQVLRADGRVVWYASPEVWPRFCTRQSSWYRKSRRSGQFMVLSGERLPRELDRFLDATLTPSDFQPPRLPSRSELAELVESSEYREEKPAEWEQVSWADRFLIKAFFSLTRFWKRGDSMKRHWLGHRANHANFIARRFVAEIEGEAVPYSITDNEGVCSSCAEFFNVVEDESRKLVRACPGAITFGGAPRHVYLDVQPVRIEV
jgi:hypothetical protein